MFLSHDPDIRDTCIEVLIKKRLDIKNNTWDLKCKPLTVL